MAAYAKAIAAGIMAIIVIVQTQFGIGVPEWLSEEWLTTVLSVLSVFLVYRIPNKP